MVYYARKTNDGRKQLLIEHLNKVVELSSKWAELFGLSGLAGTAALYHDAGKATAEFQNYLFAEEQKEGTVPHSIYGARAAYDDYFSSLPIAEMLANVIASHHGSLRDFLSPDGSTPLVSELTSSSKPPVMENNRKISPDVLFDELKAVLGTLPDKTFGIMMLVKLLYSCVVDADRMDAYLFERAEEYVPKQPDWEKMLNELNKHLKKLTAGNNKSDKTIIELRNDISRQCAEAGRREIGIYTLEVPTGGGKTLSGLRFALEHVSEHNLDRIIYVIPYLSILSQTAIEIRRALNTDAETVLEHHSNVLPDDPEYYKLHTDRWDSPIILTTQVQFLESVFSAKAGALRKLHNMARSVIIFDEIQTLPVKCVHLFNSVLNFLNKVCGTTILLCTATRPLLDKVQRPVLLSEHPSIAVCRKIPKRTEIVFELRPQGYSYEELADFVLEKHNTSTLIVVNTKAAAKSLYLQLKSREKNVLHLSTNMCPAHRDKVISDLRCMLSRGEKVICVSTQLIEAGVDISFECVIRDLAGLDSIYQAAGRCNRHGEFGEIKKVFVVNIADENLSRLEDIKIGADKTRRLFLDGQLDINTYYKHYFYERRNQMDYPTKGGGSIYDLLTKNRQGRNAYATYANSEKTQLFLTCAIRSAADEFYVIAPGQIEVLTNYGDSHKLLEEYRTETDLAEKKKLLRRLERYMVSLYKFQTDELVARGALSSDNGLTILADGFYDDELGIDIAGSHTFLSV
ncbi:MAG: CRISPR-associated helicase Cas3' [Clostridiales bacterium]|nr:CRISPR-associated helicase Cas3' [Clostridiales bacterium]